jgi:hypothetical protein
MLGDRAIIRASWSYTTLEMCRMKASFANGFFRPGGVIAR